MILSMHVKFVASWTGQCGARSARGRNTAVSSIRSKIGGSIRRSVGPWPQIRGTSLGQKTDGVGCAEVFAFGGCCSRSTAKAETQI